MILILIQKITWAERRYTFLNMGSDLNFSLSRDFPRTSRFISGLRSSPPDWNGSNLGEDLDHENHEHIVNSIQIINYQTWYLILQYLIMCYIIILSSLRSSPNGSNLAEDLGQENIVNIFWNYQLANVISIRSSELVQQKDGNSWWEALFAMERLQR